MTSLIQRFPFLADLLTKRATVASGAARAVTVPVPSTAPRVDDSALEEARGAAMRRLFPKLYSWCASRLDASLATDVHAYLSAATSVEDLERRVRIVEKSRSFGTN